MSPLWRNELRVGLCPDRLVLARSVVATDEPVRRLRSLAGENKNANLTVVLSNHFIRYAVLPWSAELRTADEWLAYAQHSFARTYGAAAAGWRIRFCPTGRRKPCIACAADATLLESLDALRIGRDTARLVSVQPYLMSAFNARRRALGGDDAWFVLQERGRLTLGLILQGAWTQIRTRNVQADWREALPDLLEREHAANGAPACEQVVLCSEEGLREGAAKFGRFSVSDATLRPGMALGLREYAMAL